MFAFAVPLLALNLKSTFSLLRSFVCKSFEPLVESTVVEFAVLFYLPEILGGDSPTVNICYNSQMKKPVFMNKTQGPVVRRPISA